MCRRFRLTAGYCVTQPEWFFRLLFESLGMITGSIGGHEACNSADIIH